MVSGAKLFSCSGVIPCCGYETYLGVWVQCSPSLELWVKSIVDLL
jgi:hypothetical protein